LEKRKGYKMPNRQEFLNALEAIAPGLSPREITEQSACYVFKDGRIYTYNDEVAASIKSPVEIEGAVVAKPLTDTLRKWVEDDIQVEQTEDKILIKGKGRRAGIRTEKEILLPIDSIEKPGKWFELGEDFIEGLSIVKECAGKNQDEFKLTCVNIGPEFMEACDNSQLSRFECETPIKESTLCRQESIKHIIALDVTEVSESDNWLHFRNPGGLIISCRRFMEEYPDLNPLLKVDGSKAALPKGLADASDKAEIFSSENTENNRVRVDIKSGKIRIRGEGIHGFYQEIKKVKYNGPPLTFGISPKLLKEITKKHNECIINETRLKVDGGKFVYVSCLENVEETHDEK